MADEIRPAGQRHYAGGQVCPGCDEVLGDADVFCRWCGAQLRERVTEGS